MLLIQTIVEAALVAGLLFVVCPLLDGLTPSKLPTSGRAICGLLVTAGAALFLFGQFCGDVATVSKLVNAGQAATNGGAQ